MATIDINGGRVLVRLTYSLNQDIAANQSVIRVTGVAVKATWDVAPTPCWLIGSVLVNGTEVVAMELGNTYSCEVLLSDGGFNGGSEGDSNFNGYIARDLTIPHQEDGCAEIAMGVNFRVFTRYGQHYVDTASGEQTLTLPQIPRTSALTAAGVELGQEMVIGLTRAAADFVDTVTWRCGTQTGVLAEKTSQPELRWTVPLELAAQAPEDTRVKVVLTVTTFLGETQAGSRDTEVYCTLPGSIVPSVAVTVEDRMGYAAQYGGYIQGQSQARVATQAAGQYGASIREIAVTCGKLSGSGEEVSFALEDSGSVSVIVTVTDSRGRSSSQKTTIAVLPYQKPWVTIREAARCDEEGNDQPDGVWLKVVFDAGVTALVGNTAQYRGLCAVHGGGDTRQVLLSDYTDRLAVTGGSMLLSAGVDTGYDCQISVQDSFCTVVSAPALVSVAFALLDLCRGTKAVGIGMRATNAGALSVGMDMNMVEHRIGNLAAPTEDTDAATKGYVDEKLRQLAQALGMTMEEDT